MNIELPHDMFHGHVTGLGRKLKPRNVLQPAVGDNCLECRRLCTASQILDKRTREENDSIFKQWKFSSRFAYEQLGCTACCT